MKAICEECGKEYNTVPREYRKNEHHYCSKECHRKVLRKTFINNFNVRVGNKYTLVEYTDKNNVTVQCKVCGNKFTRSSTQVMRIGCPYCKAYQTELNKLNASINKSMNKLLNSKQKKLDAITERLSKDIAKVKSKAISEQKRKERKKRENKIRELRREGRIKNNGEIDKDITLDKLYIRDKGVCSLCGGKCDYRDCKVNENGHFITGSLYPSIDHTIPLSKGGTHTWDNVRLAHFRCNSIKGNKIPSPSVEAI